MHVTALESDSQEAVICKLLRVLRRDGAAVLHDHSLIPCLDKLGKVLVENFNITDDSMHIALRPESHSVLAHPIIMAVVNGVIGRQVLNCDQ